MEKEPVEGGNDDTDHLLEDATTVRPARTPRNVNTTSFSLPTLGMTSRASSHDVESGVTSPGVMGTIYNGDKHRHRFSCYEILFTPSKSNVCVCLLCAIFSFLLNTVYQVVMIVDHKAQSTSVSLLLFMPFAVSVLWALWLFLQTVVWLDERAFPTKRRIV